MLATFLIIFLLFFPSEAGWAGEPGLYRVTATRVNLRSGPGTGYQVVDQRKQGDVVTVLSFHNDSWAVIKRGTESTAYISARYIEYQGPAPVENEPAPKKKRGFWAVVFLIAQILFFVWLGLRVLHFLFGNVEWGHLLRLPFIAWWIISLPFFLLNKVQFYLTKPWRPFMKRNWVRDSNKKWLRTFFSLLKIPFYLALTPLRLLNAVYYNLVIHFLYEVSNYLLEVLAPSDADEGRKSVWVWLLMLPFRVAKYLVWHLGITIVESVIWTVIDTFVPALTLYHGTRQDAAEEMVCEPHRHKQRRQVAKWATGTWTVGGGNYAGDGIYFGIARRTLRNYQDGAAIVARVSLGKTIEVSMMPNSVYDTAGASNAHAVSKWALENGYTTGEWWRDTGPWWEICLFDRQNRYNYSWRIRPVYVLNYNWGVMHRVPGGTAHWLFRKMVLQDLRCSIREFFGKKD